MDFYDASGRECYGAALCMLGNRTDAEHAIFSAFTSTIQLASSNFLSCRQLFILATIRWCRLQQATVVMIKPGPLVT
jgi:hypothetical protein